MVKIYSRKTGKLVQIIGQWGGTSGELARILGVPADQFKWCICNECEDAEYYVVILS
jgi:hypothetical protein